MRTSPPTKLAPKRNALVAYIRCNFDDEFEPDQALLDIMDSVSLLQFMLFIEQTMGVTINQADLTTETFETVDTVLAFLEEQ